MSDPEILLAVVVVFILIAVLLLPPGPGTPLHDRVQDPARA